MIFLPRRNILIYRLKIVLLFFFKKKEFIIIIIFTAYFIPFLRAVHCTYVLHVLFMKVID